MAHMVVGGIVSTYHKLGSLSNHVKTLPMSASMVGVMAFRDFGLLKVSSMTCSRGNSTLISLE